MSSDFDGYKDRYREAVQESIAFVGQEMEFFTELKADHLLRLAERQLGAPSRLRVLDVGCGVGLTDRFLAGRVGELHGVDVAEGVLERAARDNPSARYRVYDGKSLPFSDGEMDLVFAICVLHHVPPEARAAFVGEMARVASPGGVVAIYEHNPINPLTRIAVSRCEFDAGVVLAGRGGVARLMRGAGLTPVARSYIVFFPFRSKVFARIERALGWLPLGGQHCVAGRKAVTG